MPRKPTTPRSRPAPLAKPRRTAKRAAPPPSAPAVIGDNIGVFTYAEPRDANAALGAAGFVWMPSAARWHNRDGREAVTRDTDIGNPIVVTVVHRIVYHVIVTKPGVCTCSDVYDHRERNAAMRCMADYPHADDTCNTTAARCRIIACTTHGADFAAMSDDGLRNLVEHGRTEYARSMAANILAGRVKHHATPTTRTPADEGIDAVRSDARAEAAYAAGYAAGVADAERRRDIVRGGGFTGKRGAK